MYVATYFSKFRETFYNVMRYMYKKDIYNIYIYTYNIYIYIYIYVLYI